tara:strand:- start:6529 stop:7296 length:768 start_codon:yes stop_codon:yes gene_type:complete
MGFFSIVKKKIFEETEINQLRNYFKEKDFFNKNIELLDLEPNDILLNFILSKKLINFLKQSLNDDFYFIGGSVIQKNNRTKNLEKYHKDSGKIHQSGILSKKENLYVKIGIMLQDNIKGDGGGIDYLKPMIFDNFSDNSKILNKLRAIYYFFQDKLFDTHFYTKSGDVIFFSAMLSHRTSFTKKDRSNFIKDKYVIYNQITNLNLIKDVIKITRKNRDNSNFQIEDNINVINVQGEEIKILKPEFASEISNYVGA